MSCPSCKSENRTEFSSEMILHIGGPQNVDKPGVWLFPKILVCPDCGFARFMVPVAELTLLVGEPTTRERFTGAGGC